MTKYLEIAKKIRFDIVSGRLPPGTKIPSIRELAKTMGVNQNTNQRALKLLELEGLIVYPQLK